jgi:hypothetical protein
MRLHNCGGRRSGEAPGYTRILDLVEDFRAAALIALLVRNPLVIVERRNPNDLIYICLAFASNLAGRALSNLH